MTKVTINPGICGLIATITAQTDDDDQVVLTIDSACTGVGKIIENLGDTFDPYEICLTKPGQNPLYDFAAKAFPGHAGCPVIAGIVKCIEVEAGLALPKNASITFEE